MWINFFPTSFPIIQFFTYRNGTVSLDLDFLSNSQTNGTSTPIYFVFAKTFDYAATALTNGQERAFLLMKKSQISRDSVPLRRLLFVY